MCPVTGGTDCHVTFTSPSTLGQQQTKMETLDQRFINTVDTVNLKEEYGHMSESDPVTNKVRTHL